MWNYYRDEPNSDDNDDNDIKHSIIDSKSFDYKANVIGSVTHNDLTKDEVKIVVLLKYLSKFLEKLKYAIN